MNVIRPLIEILIFAIILYLVLRFMEGTRGQGIMKGTLIFFLSCFGILFLLTLFLQLPHVKFFLESIADIFFLALIIIFQPELRNGLIRLGRFSLRSRSMKQRVSEETIAALSYLSAAGVGAMIAIENDIGLGNWVEKGVQIDGIVSKELLCTIFWPGTNLHDGAVIINKYGQLAAATCLFPMSETTDVDPTMGTRHRAALGLSEETDALVLVVSEETGIISVATRGKLRQNPNLAELSEQIDQVFTKNAIKQNAKQNNPKKMN